MTRFKKALLQLFAEEGMADSGFAATSADAGSSGGVATDSGNASEVAPQEGQESFADLIGKNGKYHKEYNDSVKEAINKRFKNQADNQKTIDRMSPLFRLEAIKYGIALGKDGEVDLDALEKAISDDNSLYEQEAFDKGMAVEDLKRQKQLEMDNERLRAENERWTRQQEQDREWSEIMAQAAELQKVYPNFNIDEEMENPTFGRLLATFRNSGFPDALKTAYQSVHQAEILAGGMQYAVQRTAENMSKAIASGSKRPKENGTSSRASGNFEQTDPSRYKIKDFAEIRRRAERGERITLD